MIQHRKLTFHPFLLPISSFSFCLRLRLSFFLTLFCIVVVVVSATGHVFSWKQLLENIGETDSCCCTVLRQDQCHSHRRPCNERAEPSSKRPSTTARRSIKVTLLAQRMFTGTSVQKLNHSHNSASFSCA